MRIVKGIMSEQEEKEKERIGMTEFLLSAIKCRMPGGDLFEILAADISSNARVKRILFDVFNIFAGGKVSYWLFPAMNVEITGDYTAEGFLYHLTPVHNLKAIKQKGIISKRNHVFLTDDVEYIIDIKGYPDWKANELSKNTDFCVLKIDASSLKKRRKIFFIDREHELVTKKIEPEYIIVDYS